MKIDPIKRPRKKPVALIHTGWRSVSIFTIDGVVTAQGPESCYKALAKMAGHTCYVSGSLRSLLHTAPATYWQAETWRGKATSMSLDGTNLKVTSLRKTLEGLGDPDAIFTALLEVVHFLETKGVSAGSISSMAWQLWRASLSSQVSLGFDSKISRQALYGGRQSATPNRRPYTDHVALDISSAYPTSMAARNYTSHLREVSRLTEIDPNLPGLAMAKVFVPKDLPYAPLPVRLGPEMISFRFGEFTGLWPWNELAAAVELGARVEVQRCWAPVDSLDLFGPWWGIVQEGREYVSSFAAPLFKSICNSLWGMFAMLGDDRAVIRWIDDYGDHAEIVGQVSRKIAQANTLHVAAETTARVRTRMLTEGLYGYAMGHSGDTRPIHVDTDGVIVPRSALSNFHSLTIGDQPGDWRVKTAMKRVEVRGPQLYRYTAEGSKGWHYVASGLPQHRAEEFFNKVGPEGVTIAVNGLDSVITSENDSLGPFDLEKYRREADALASGLYGPRLV